MNRPSRHPPTWILLGAAVVILGAVLVSSSYRAASSDARDGVQANPSTPAREVVAAVESAQTLGSPKSPKSPSAPAAPSAPARDASIANRPEAPRSAEPVGMAGMLVGIDPETGRLGMPSREFRDELRNAQEGGLRNPALSRSMEGLTVIHRPDGSKMIDLKGRFQEYTVVRIAPDGRKEQTCVQGPDVEAALQGTTGASPADAEASASPADAEANTTSDSQGR